MKATYIQRMLFDESKPCDQMTDEQRSLAIKWRHYALQLAKRWHHCYGGNLADWQSEAMMGLCLAAVKFEPARESINGGAVAFVSCVWHQVRSKLNVFRLTRDHGGMRYVPRGRLVKQDVEAVCDRAVASEHSWEVQDVLESAKSRLDETEQLILRRRFDVGETLEVVGKRIGVTRERVRQIQERALDKMREVLVDAGVEYAGCH
jgi:RNA polymerase sigma factor (sigma-70 family)